MKILGLDPATNSGVAIIGDEAEHIGIISTKLKGMARVYYMRDALTKIVAEHAPTHVFIEGYGQTSKMGVSSFITLVEIGTAYRMVLHEHRIPYIEVPPSTLKKFVTGRGNAKKPQMIAAVRERWHVAGKLTHDVADAYGLAQLGRAYFGVAEWKISADDLAIIGRLRCH